MSEPIPSVVLDHMERTTDDPAALMEIRRRRGTEGSRVAPWLVLLSQHAPEACDDGDVSCSCGNPLYVGHLVRLIADRVDELTENPTTSTTTEGEH